MTRLKYRNANVVSGQLFTNRGVPQGSILGPLLFVIYFNDVYAVRAPSVGGELSIMNYADDTSLLVCGDSLAAVVDGCSSYMENIERWLNSNSLVINHNKTNILFFKTKHKKYPEYIHLNNRRYDVCRSTRLLGVTIDDCLRWDEHIHSVCTKMSSWCYAFSQLRNIVSQHVLWVAYYGCCYPLLRFGIVVWGGGSELRRLFVVQKKLLRTILALRCYQSCRGCFRSNDVLTVAAIYIYECLLFLFKNKHLFEQYLHGHHYATRNRADYCYPRHRLTLTENSLAYSSLRFFNALPSRVKNISDFKCFKRDLFILLCNIEPYNTAEYFSNVVDVF